MASRNSLRGSQITVSIMGSPPFVIYGKILAGVDIDLLNFLRRKFKFSYKLKLERSWGRKNPKTGNWTGTIGSVNTSILYIKIRKRFL